MNLKDNNMHSVVNPTLSHKNVKPNFWNSFKTEFKAEAFEHKRRVIKMIGLSLVPFLYIFICIWAFWNPFMQIDKIPAAIVDYNVSQKWAYHYDNQSSSFEQQLTNTYFHTADDKHSDVKFTGPLMSWAVKPMISDPETQTIHFEKQGSMIRANMKYVNTLNAGDLNLDNQYWVQMRVPNGYGDRIAGLLTNFMQFPIINANSKTNAADNKVLVEKYYQALNNNVRALAGQKVIVDTLAMSDPYYTLFDGAKEGDYHNQTLQFWSTYKNNYISGYFMNIFSGLMDGLAKDLVPSLIGGFGTGMAALSQQEVNSAISDHKITNHDIWIDHNRYDDRFNPKRNYYFKAIMDFANVGVIHTLLPELSQFLNLVKTDDNHNSIIDQWFNDAKNTVHINQYTTDAGAVVKNTDVINRQTFYDLLTANILSKVNGINLDGLIQKQVQGEEFNEYGIGLGEFFICIGAYVGTLVQTIVLDRKKRLKGTHFVTQYFVKTLMMWIVAVIQISIAAVTIYAIGWSQIGPTFGLQYLWMVFTITTFVFIIQGLWFLIRDELLARIAIIVLVIISLTSGWGTFPGFMQSDLFHVLSYITPYTYSIHGQGIIIYGIASLGSSWYYTSDILTNFGILWVYIVVFAGLGLYGIWRNDRVRDFATSSSRKVGAALQALGWEDYLKPAHQHDRKTNSHVHADLSRIPFSKYEVIRNQVITMNPRIKMRTHWYRDLDERD